MTDEHDDYELAQRALRRPRRKRMRQFRIDELSLVDRPAQEGALITITKREDHPMSLRHLKSQMDQLDAKLDTLTARMQKADEEEQEAADRLRELFQGRSSEDDDEDPDPDDDLEIGGFEMAADENDMEEFDETTDTDDLDLRDAEGHEVNLDEDNPADLDEEEKALSSPLSYDDEDLDHDDVHPEVAALARKLRKQNWRLSTRMARLMACGRLMAAHPEAYSKRYLKATSAITTDTGEPFFGREQEERRRLMDRRAQAHRRKLDQIIAEMHSQAPRKISNVEALRRARKAYPGLFR